MIIFGLVSLCELFYETVATVSVFHCRKCDEVAFRIVCGLVVII